MNTSHKPTIRVMGNKCEHTFYLVGGERVRSGRAIPPSKLAHDSLGDPIRVKGCPVPKCARTSVIPVPEPQS